MCNETMQAFCFLLFLFQIGLVMSNTPGELPAARCSTATPYSHTDKPHQTNLINHNKTQALLVLVSPAKLTSNSNAQCQWARW